VYAAHVAKSGQTHPANLDEYITIPAHTLSLSLSLSLSHTHTHTRYSHAGMDDAGAYEDDEEEAEAGDAGQKRGDDRDAGTILKRPVYVPVYIVNILGH
jgi:hypothetical protein